MQAMAETQEWTYCFNTEPLNQLPAFHAHSLSSRHFSSISHGSCLQRWRVSEIINKTVNIVMLNMMCYLKLNEAVEKVF